MYRTCGPPSAHELRTSPEFAEQPAACDDCGEEISANDVSTEEFEITAELVCQACADARNERRVDAFWSGPA